MQINSYKYHQYQFHHHPHHSIVHHSKIENGTKMKSNVSDNTTADIPNEKYSLRQRQKRSTRTNKQSDNSSMDGITDSSPAIEIIPQTKTNKKSSGKAKSKQKAAPLSKYRRKTANARERIRMREINSAFEHLRNCVPLSICEGSPTTNNEKLTKITTLRLAMKYISTLNDILNSSFVDSETSQLLDSIINKTTMQLPSSSNTMENNNDITAQNNNNKKSNMKSLSTTRTMGKRKSKKSETTANKAANNKRRKTKPKSTTTKTTRVKTAKKAKNFDSIPNTCLTPPLSSTDSPIDLGLMLESDGESLHLSEPCLSPPLSSCQQTKAFNTSIVSPPSSITMSNGLDIGLFLDSDTDSLHFPEPCLSPLDAGFDTLSPFGDLLHAGFAEPTSLDIYLT